MIQEELNRFLASVRRTRFVDYLDPMGETAHEALDRRLKWAERSHRDPAHADEATFLLRHEKALRDLLSQELLESDDDWVEAEEVGAGWGGQSAWTSSAPAPERSEPDPDPELDEDDDPDMERTGIMRLEDLTNPPVPPRLDPPVIGGRPTYSNAPADEDLPDELVRDIWNRNAPDGAPTYKSTPSSGLVEHDLEEEPAEQPQATPPPVPRSPVPSPSPSPERTEDRSALNIRASRQGAPAPRMEAQRRPVWVPVVGFLVLFMCGALVAWDSGKINLPGLPSKAQVADGAVAVEPAQPEEAVAEVEPEEPEVVEEIDEAGEAGPAGEEVVEEPEAGGATPEPVQPKPAPEPARVAAAPAPAPPTPAPVPSPEPAAPQPAPKPAPQPAPAPAPQAAPAPAPAPAPAAVAQTEPPPQEAATDASSGSNAVKVPMPEAVAYPQITGMWVGLAASRSFQLKVDSQSGASFSGTAEVMDESGAWQKLPILGSVKEDGGLKFSQVGGGASFSGSLDGIRASGTVKLTPDGAVEKWSVIK